MLGIGKIFGRGKKAEYFLTFDESQGKQSAPTEPKPKKAKAEAKSRAKQPQSKSIESGSEVVEVIVVEPPEAEQPKSEKKKKKSIKEIKAEKAAQSGTSAAPKAPSSPKPLPPLNELAPTPAGMNFSTDHLLPQPTASRRRPGPSLNMFKDMARQVGRR
ncbi:MAG: hypothetical protein HC835_10720 [Oscillatoriales cyanobacterium RM2_1_1]|nr:hypothetical protein [Oscillatoriales cyanobacterium SM2_3_0]NJO46054.1 hypothetical protein [Oscillatoriales cyanobacterium RM2_1_1]